MGGHPCDVNAIDDDAPASGRCQSGERSTERCLADSVATEDGRDLAALGAQRGALQHVAVTVIRVDVNDFEHVWTENYLLQAGLKVRLYVTAYRAYRLLLTAYCLPRSGCRSR